MKPTSSPWTWALVALSAVVIVPVLGVAVVAAVVLPPAAQACGDDDGTVTAMSGKWRAPMASAYAVTSEFGPRYHPVLHVTKVHTGIDLVASGNKTIVAAADGKVVERGVNTAYGNQVVIDNGGGITTRYAHMATPAKVHRGQKVGAGTPLGTMGATGYVTGPHLHFEVIRKGTPINPKPFMAAHGAPLNGKAPTTSKPKSTTPAGSTRAPERATPAATKIPSKITAKGPGGRPYVIQGEQLRIAKAIARIGTERGAGSRGIVIAYMTAFQESRMRQINYGDRDSLSVFQQRPSQGWGTVAQIMRLDYTIAAFFGGPEGPNHGSPRGLLDVKGWKKMGLGEAAQTVQGSAFPHAYDQWEPLARSLNNALGGGGLEPTGECQTETVARASSLRVMTWNVDANAKRGTLPVWSDRQPRLASTIKDSGADVVALQGTSGRTTSLARTLRPTYRVAVSGRSEALLYNPARVSITANGKPLAARTFTGGTAQLMSLKTGGQRFVATSADARSAQATRRAQRVAKGLSGGTKVPMVHAGTLAPAALHGFRSAEQTAKTRDGQEWATLNGGGAPRRGTRTDHVLIDPRLVDVVTWSQLLAPDRSHPDSDHHALVVDLTWRTSHAA